MAYPNRSSSSSTPLVAREALPLLLVGLIPYAVLVVAHWGLAPLAESGDYAHYLLHARALAEGRPYGDTGYLYTAYAYVVGPRLYPPGFPLTLAPFVAVFGVASPVLKVLTVLSGAAFLLLAGAYLARLAGAAVGAAAIAITGVALETAHATNTVIPDLGFAALLWGAFLVMESPKVSLPWRVALVAALGLGAMSYRAAGLALIPAFALYALVNRDQRRAAVAVLGVWLAAAVVVLALAPEVVPFRTQLLFSFETFATRITRSLTGYWRPTISAELYPFPGDLPNDVYHLVASLLVLGGAGVAIWRQPRRLIWSFAVAYGLMLALAPVRDGRYLWPLFPLIALGLVVGFRSLAAIVVRRHASPVAVTALVLLVAAATVRTLRTPSPPTIADNGALLDVFAWVRELGQRETTRVVFVNPRVLTLYAGVPAMPMVVGPTPERLRSLLEEYGITHVVEGDPQMTRGMRRSYTALMDAYAGRFRLEYENPPYRVYRFLPAGM